MNQALSIGRYAALALCIGTVVTACATPADDDETSNDLPTVEPVGTSRQALPPCDEFGDCFREPYTPTWPIAAP